LLAGERAKTKHANVDAAEFYRRALDASRVLPAVSRADVGRAWESLGDVLELSGDYAEARIAYDHAREQLRGDADARAGLALKEGRLRESLGNYAEALRWYSRGLRELDALDETRRSRHRLRLSLGYAAARYRQGAPKDCIAWVERVVADARGAGALQELAHAYYLLHLAYTSLGSPERVEVRDLALPIYEELGDLLGQANALNNLGIDAYYEGRWDAALDYYERSRTARQRIGDVVGAATIANNIAEILSDQGRIEEAETLLHEVHETCEAAGSRLMTAVADANLGRAAARSARYDDARAALTRALEALRAIEAGSFVVETQARLAEVALFSGDLEGALAAADEAASITDATAAPNVQALLHRVRGYALLKQGRIDEASAELDRSLATARAADMLYEVALTLRARARLSDDAHDLDEAQAILDALHVAGLPELD
jgi:tetratricopeptide (TPR) repeat protein